MKQIIVLIMIFATATSVLAQTPLVAGDNCFDKGDYVCAQKKYQEAIDTATGRDKQMAEIRYSRANSCNNWLTVANRAFNNNSYESAKENYQWVLNENPKDMHAKSQIEKCDAFISAAAITRLKLSTTELIFQSEGGSQVVNIDADSKSYTIELLPSWCTVDKYSDYFIIRIGANYNAVAKTDYFNVKNGNKTIRVNITQHGISKVKETSLNVSKQNLNFLSAGGVENIMIKTDANKFSLESIPYWIKVNQYTNYILVSCIPNNMTTSRSDWFKIISDNKEVKIYVNQSATTESSSLLVKKEKQKPVKRRLGSFSSLGIQSGEIAFLGLLYESGGISTVGFHISARTSLLTEKKIWNDVEEELNKTEIQLGPNFKISKRLYLNIGGGYGYSGASDDLISFENIEESGYFVGTAGLMIRLTRVININGGVSFMNVDKDFDNPEITFGISFNLKGKNRY